jgi:Flp pilus assembly protein TadD
MVPPAPVLTNKKAGRRRGTSSVILAVWLIGFAGCSPPGPRALLQGKKALDEGRAREAVPLLEKAVTLLPKQPLAWNYLGLAYHANGQAENAMKAYRTALALDHKLSIVRYNLGCLYLEQTNAPAAVDELRSYSLLQPGAVDGWVRLGTALVQARRLDEAERSFRTAIELHPKHPEAMNGLGLIQLQRRHWQEAFNHFTVAAVHEPPYPPAVLNSAVVAQQYLGNRTLALQRYRQYLTLQPPPPDTESVDAIVRRLEHELNPNLAVAPTISTAQPPRTFVPPAPVVASSVGTSASRTNATTPSIPPSLSPVVRPPANVPAALSATSRSNALAANNANTPAFPSATTTAAALASKVAPPPSTNAVALAISARAAPAESLRSTTKVAAAKAPEPPKVPVPDPAPRRSAEIEVAQVQPELLVKPPQELSLSQTASTAPASGDAAGRAATNQARKGFFNRLNPFSGSGRPRESDELAAASVPATAPVRAAAPPEIGPTRPVPRYNYVSPVAPTSGNHSEAEKDFRKGLKAHKAGNRPEAIADYQNAVRNDPAYYDAYYNLGLVTLENGSTRLSLWAYEIALALKPESEDARYNFALALKSAGYWLDAVEELKRLVASSPSDARSHLSLGNLYSQQLRQPELARAHYERLLELNPRHPEAGRIRYWLSLNQ